MQTMTTSEPSRFSKDELPAWSDIMEWYEYFEDATGEELYIPDDNCCDIDQYWKVPRKLVLMAGVCNQFNKMILEDGFKDDLLKYLNEPGDNPENVDDIIFEVLGAAEVTQLQYKGSCAIGQLPDVEDDIIKRFYRVYGIRHPLGKEDIFKSDDPHEYVNDIINAAALIPVLKLSGSTMYHRCVPYKPCCPEDTIMYRLIVEWMMTPFKEYFREPQGWKDENGNPISNTQGNYIIGFDPAK